MKIYNSNPDQQTRSNVQLKIYADSDRGELDDAASQRQPQDNEFATEEFWAGRNLAMRQSARIAA
jgi:hypothetical protein